MLFKMVQARVVQLVLKETSNAVRDAAVKLLIEFKLRLGD